MVKSQESPFPDLKGEASSCAGVIFIAVRETKQAISIIQELVKSNCWAVLSSDIEEDKLGEGLLLPSDPPDDAASDSDSEAGQDTPIRWIPALLSRFENMETLQESAPSAVRQHLRPLQCSSSLPPQDLPDDFHVRSEYPTSDNILLTPRTEKNLLLSRREALCQQSQLSNCKNKAITTERKRAEAEQREVYEKEMKTKSCTTNSRRIKSENTSGYAHYDVLHGRNLRFLSEVPGLKESIGIDLPSLPKSPETSRDFLIYICSPATDYVAKVAFTESRAIEKSGVLSKTKKVINERFFLDFSLANLLHTIWNMAPMVFQVFNSFSTTTHQLKKGSEKFLEKKELMKGTATLTLLHGASQNNNYAQSVNGIYLAATDGQHQHFPVLSIYGFSIGYTSIISSPAKSRLMALTYDNINLINQIAEQILSQKSAQENGTCTTLPLHNAKLEHLLTSDLDESILNAPPLTLEDIILDEADSKFLTKNMWGGFRKMAKELNESQPVSADVINVYKTPLHPLLAMEIDESSITGNRGSQSWESTSILTSILASIPALIFDQESTPESMFSRINAESMFRLRSRNSMRIHSRIGPGIDVV
ncbi:hypothetical protein K438DRAFT_2126551 [Mycena galopus ATCC 62051]|nr:hypothetical protein K438DRAFT_2126551 [Mycena galopus ATCC 62051]